MNLEIRLIRVAPRWGGIQSDEVIVEFVVTPHNLFDVAAAIIRIAHETMAASPVSPAIDVMEEQSMSREYIANQVVDAARSVMGLMDEDDGEHQLRFAILRERLAAFDAAHANDQLPSVSSHPTAEKEESAE